MACVAVHLGAWCSAGQPGCVQPPWASTCPLLRAHAALCLSWRLSRSFSPQQTGIERQATARNLFMKLLSMVGWLRKQLCVCTGTGRCSGQQNGTSV